MWNDLSRQTETIVSLMTDVMAMQCGSKYTIVVHDNMIIAICPLLVVLVPIVPPWLT